jgi:S-formylglutathione hydrolase FrmB
LSELELGAWLPTVGGIVVDGETAVEEVVALAGAADVAEVAGLVVEAPTTAKLVPASTVTVPVGSEGSGSSVTAPESL